MIDGYVFIDYHPQAVIVLDEELTKVDIVKRGWASWPARILSDPKTEGMKGPIFPNEAEADKAVAARKAFKIGRWYYALEAADYHTSKFEQPYWKKGGTTDEYVLNLILAALSAPTINHPHTPYYYHLNTAGGERVDMTAWDFNVGKDGRNDDGLGIGTVIERTKLPGIGYSFVKSTLTYDNPKDGERWPFSTATAAGQSENFSVVINFPNCELGSDTCVEFKLKYETERVPFTTPRGGVGYNPKFTLCQLSYYRTFFPGKIRSIPMPRFQPRTSTNTVSCYVLTRQEEMKFVEKLSSKNISDQVKSFLYGDGSDSILSLKWFYGIRPNISTARKVKITLGNYVIDDLVVPVFAGDFTQVYMGHVFVRGPFQDYRDYSNARYQMYIPMLGHIDLNPSQVVGKNVHLLYTINLTDGSAIVTLATTEVGKNLTKTNDWYETADNIFTTSITYGYDIPLNVKSVKDDFSKFGEVVSRSIAGGAAGAIAGNVPGAVLGAAAGAASSNPITASYSSGSQTPNSNVMGDFTPKINVFFNKDRGGDFSSVAGYPCGKLVKVGDASGYLKAAMVYGTPSTTMQHTDEIVNMLKEGIYIS